MSALDEIVKGIIGEYDAENLEDTVLASLIRRIQEGKATYGDVERLASRTGTRAGQLIAAQLSDLAVDGRVTEEQARALLMGMTQHNYDIVSGAAADVQESLNRRAGLGLKAVRPEFNRDRVEGLITEVVGKEDVQAFGKTLTQQVENVSMATVDDSVKANAKAHYNAGLMPKIRRVTDGKCCKWCDKLQGVHDYYQVNNTGNDIFRRHANCDCQVLYDPGDGKKWQDVHSKRLISADERDKIEARIKAGLDQEQKTPEQRVAEANRYLNSARLQFFSMENVNLNDEYIGKSIGAAFQNMEIVDFRTGEAFHLAEGSKLQNKVVFAGKGSKPYAPYRNAWKYVDKFKGTREEDWQHVKAQGEIDYYGERRKAEIHWSQHEAIGKVDPFIKKWLD